MAVSSVTGLAGVISQIKSPEPGPDYSVHYTGYLSIVRYVTDLHVKHCVLSCDSGDRVGLDSSVGDIPVVSQAETEFRIEQEGKVLDVVPVSRGDRSGGGVRSVVGDNGFVADAAGQEGRGCSSVAGLVRDVDSVTQVTGKSKSRRKRKRRGVRTTVGVVDPRVCSGAVGLSEAVGIGAVPGTVVCAGSVGSGASVCSGTGRAYSPKLESWRSSDGDSDVTGSSSVSSSYWQRKAVSDEVEARSSYWRRKHVENLVAIERGMALLGAGGAAVGSRLGVSRGPSSFASRAAVVSRAPLMARFGVGAH